MKEDTLLPYKLQLFAEGGEGSEGGTPEPDKENTGRQTAIDYEKLANLINGKQSVTEETVLKNYFRNQGLSQDEMTQAIAKYKEEKAKNTPNVDALQADLAKANEKASKAEIEQKATMSAFSLGIDAKAIPYVIKLADFTAVKKEDGSVDDEKLTNALKKVLDDVPQFKPSSSQTGGFHFGSNGGSGGDNTDDQLKSIFGIT